MSKTLKFSVTTISSVTTALFTGWFFNKLDNQVNTSNESYQPRRNPKSISRDQHVKNLRSGEEYDILIIGGGITGVGCALDAASRGLKTALVELNDFSSGASSKSTKLLHGGIRNLQSAIFNLDYEQYKLIKEALVERKIILNVAPHLIKMIPIMLPIYKYWQLPYYWTLIKIYDLLSWNSSSKSSYFVSKSAALELFPLLKPDELIGAIIYHDGQVNDTRLNLAVALTAARYGATVCNYIEVIKLLKRINSQGEAIITGVRVKDHIAGKRFNISAKCVINATGPFTDQIRKMDDITIEPICSPSSGTHIVLPGYYCAQDMGLLDPYTTDGRVIFFLPWKKHTIVGTTDTPVEVTYSPQPKESEVLFILSEVKKYVNQNIEVRRGDVLSAWCGMRSLVRDPKDENIKTLIQKHVIEISRSKLVTVAGGKLTVYREMAQQTIDSAIKACSLHPKLDKSITDKIAVEGGLFWSPQMYFALVQDFGLELDVAEHLANTYGSKAFCVAKLAASTGKRWPIIGNKIHPDLPYIEAEIRYGIREYVCTAVDLIARRLCLSVLNVEAARESLPKIVDILAEELKWSDVEKKIQLKKALEFLDIEMGGELNKLKSEDILKSNMTEEEIYKYMERFKTIDKDKKGFISINDIRRTMKCYGEDEIDGKEIHKILSQLDCIMNGQVNINEYLKMMSIIKTGQVDQTNNDFLNKEIEKLKKNINIERSGGGV